MSTKRRLKSLAEKLQEQELDALLVSSPENRRYLSGFTGSAGYLLMTADQAVLATDFRYVEQAGRQAPDFRVERIAGGPGWLPSLAADIGAKRIGFESDHLTVAGHSTFVKAVEESSPADRPALLPTTEVVERMRAIKDKDEVGLLKKAVEIADEAIEQVRRSIEPGVTEAEVAWELEKAMRDRGAESASFDIIVGAGPNGALPHHRADDTEIQGGEPIVIDMGAIYLGYCSDLTRTLVLGDGDETFKTVYQTVLDAQIAAEEQVRAGMTGEEVDAIARDVIADAGYGEHFGHSLGHGVGLAVHEFPRVGPRSQDRIEEGMVFTVEPGIYLSGWGGVRIEDIVVLENGRAQVISRASK